MTEWLSTFWQTYGNLLIDGTWDTIVMVLASTAFAYLFGVPIGVLVTITSKNSLKPHRILNMVLGWIVNIGRSVPFIILLVALIPVTRWVMGTALGVRGAIFPLVVSATPFVARMIEQSLQEVDGGLIEAAQSFGASVWQIVWKVMLKEALPSIIRGCAITLITLFGYTAMAGAVGAGGLGDIAIRYGYYRYQDDVMIVTVILLVILVQIAQTIGDRTARKVDKR